MTSYAPLMGHPLFYLGIILMAVGTLTAVFNFFATLYIAKRDKTYTGSVPLVVFGALLIAIDASSYTRGVGFDKLISIGNMSDLDFADLKAVLEKGGISSFGVGEAEGLERVKKAVNRAVATPKATTEMRKTGPWRRIWSACFTGSNVVL